MNVDSDTVIDFLQREISRLRDLDPSSLDVRLDSTLGDDLDVDSLSLIELGILIEGEFDVELGDGELESAGTVADLVALLSAARVESA